MPKSTIINIPIRIQMIETRLLTCLEGVQVSISSSLSLAQFTNKYDKQNIYSDFINKSLSYKWILFLKTTQRERDRVENKKMNQLRSDLLTEATNCIIGANIISSFGCWNDSFLTFLFALTI
jgi:hypothetical protein